MKIFISWSGERSKKIAEKLKQWLSLVIQTTKPFVSSKDIPTGELWRTKIAKELQGSDFGIICITQENKLSPWILFESGALSKNMDSKVVPLLFGISMSEISNNPLSAFQSLEYSKEAMKKLVYDINEVAEHQIERPHLDLLFDIMFPSLQHDIEKVLELPADSTDNIANESSSYVDILTGIEKSNAPEIVKSLLSWGYGISKIVRTKQTYDFVMEDSQLKKDGKSAVKIIGTHVYTVANKSDIDSLNISIYMKDELGLQSVEDGWGFESLFYTIEGENRKEYPIRLADSGDGAKKNLGLSFEVPPKKNIKFEYVSVGVFLPSDRYIWYSQEFCENCIISITNNTTIADIHRYQINHRDEQSIKHQIQSKEKTNKINIDRNIYPREGFTMYWRAKRING